MISMDSIKDKLGCDPFDVIENDSRDDQRPAICDTDISISELEFLFQEALRRSNIVQEH